MYNSSSLRSKCSKRKRLFSFKGRERCDSEMDLDDLPYSLSNCGSQISLHSTLKKNGALPSRPCPLFQRSSSGIWNSFDAENDMECQEKDGKTIMKVHNEDRTYKSILLDDDMRVGQVCKIMLDKNHRQESIIHWQIFEEPGDFPGFERQVEDHEFAMDLQRRWPAAAAPSRIWFRCNKKKYNFSNDLDHLLLRGDTYDSKLWKNRSLPGILEGVVMLKRPRNKWSKVFCFLVMSAIFFSKRRFGYSRKKAKYLLDLTSMDVYVPQERTDVTKILRTPTPHTLLLVPSSIGLLDPEAIFAIGVETRDCMLAWAEGLRLHKHGQRKLTENLEDALNDRFCPPTEMVLHNDHQANGNSEGQTTTPIARETPRSYRQIQSPQQYFFGNNYQPKNESSINMCMWSAYSPEDKQGCSDIDDNSQNDRILSVSTLKGSIKANSITQFMAYRRSYLREGLGSRPSVYESMENFEGIIFRSGFPYLLLELPDGLHKYSIEVSQDRNSDEKRYKLPSRSEKFETLVDLCTFYENRRHLLTEDSEMGEGSLLFPQPLSFQADAATEF